MLKYSVKKDSSYFVASTKSRSYTLIIVTILYNAIFYVKMYVCPNTHEALLYTLIF
jgi:hypothetical protein